MDKKVIIIGSGASGFAAASKLLANGFQNVQILEAESRIGGRVHTIPFASNVVDLGAQWCHGEKGNVVYDMAKDKNLLSSNVQRYDSFDFIESNMECPVPAEITKRFVRFASETLDRLDVRDKQAYKGSIGNYFAERYFEAMRSEEFRDVDINLQREMFEWLHMHRSMYVACDSWYEASCRGYHEYWECPGEQFLHWKDKGYRTVFDLLQNKIPLTESTIDVESKVLLNKQVVKIQYDTTSSTSERIKIRCSDDSEYFCDHLICTVSLGVLKRNHLTLFEPFLPVEKVNSINGLGFGTVGKIYVEFTEPIWEKDWEGISLLWRTNELAKIPDNGEWLKSIFGFYTVRDQPNVMCGRISGEAARKMEQVSDSDFEAGMRHVLRIFQGNWHGKQVKNIIRTKWYSNSHFLGSYSFYSLKSDALDASPAALAEPILDYNTKPIIQFAGEATHSHFYSTVHGAIETGWREAQRLIDSYKRL